MSYYGAGDYYGAGGWFTDLIGGGLGVIGSVIPGVGGDIVSKVGGWIKGGTKNNPPQPQVIPITPSTMPISMAGPPPTIQPTPGIKGTIQRIVPGGATGYEVVIGKKRRRMNVGNAKALRRAIRREQGFVKLARRALKGTGYRITTRGSTRGGSRGVITRSEAARALRS